MDTVSSTSLDKRSPVYTGSPSTDDPALRTPAIRARRRRWPAILAAAIIGAGIAAVAVSSYYDDRSLGERVDATVAAGEQSVRSNAAEAARGGAVATERVATVLSDAGITAAVKTSLAADPGLSALKIDVTTQDGVVSLSGPAPDAKARERAEVLAAAPNGVVRVENRLVVGAN